MDFYFEISIHKGNWFRNYLELTSMIRPHLQIILTLLTYLRLFKHQLTWLMTNFTLIWLNFSYKLTIVLVLHTKNNSLRLTATKGRKSFGKNILNFIRTLNFLHNFFLRTGGSCNASGPFVYKVSIPVKLFFFFRSPWVISKICLKFAIIYFNSASWKTWNTW